MKICWDNLEKLEYLSDKKEWKNKNWAYYVYEEFCKGCGKPYLTRKNSKGLFCNNSCARKGKKLPKEVREKISKSLTGRKHSPETKEKIKKSNSGKNNFWYGKSLSKHHKKKISKSKTNISWGKHSKETIRKFQELNKREKNPNWKNGVTKRGLPFYDTYAGQISYCEEVKRNKHDIDILEIKCAYCGKWFIPKRVAIINRICSLEGNQTGECRLYCSAQCKKECPTYKQIKYPKGFKSATSREVQPELRQLCFERDNYTCQKCKKHQNELQTGLHCHHIEGIRHEPLESADLDNVITVCKTCHKEIHKQPDCGYYDMRCKKLF